jgi:nucleotide-binding universal stress UspA family protein
VPEAILSVADIEEPDLLLMGWNERVRGSRTRGSNVAGVVKGANRNVLVLKDNGLDQINRILVPTAGGPHAKLGLRVAQDLATDCGASVTAMTVQVGRGHSAARSEFDHESLEFFQGLAEEYSREALRDAGVDAEISAVIDSDVGEAIVKAASDYDLVVIGASNEWRLRQWLFGSLPDKVTNRSSASVLMVRSGA